jgi:hypothetical protein
VSRARIIDGRRALSRPGSQPRQRLHRIGGGGRREFLDRDAAQLPATTAAMAGSSPGSLRPCASPAARCAAVR